MLGLFRYRYDYYEWEDLIAVSEDVENLIKKFHDINTDDEISCILIEELHKSMQGNEERHYMIKEVELI